MNSEFCDRYRERKSPNRQMIALRGAKVDLSKWELISFSANTTEQDESPRREGLIILKAARTACRLT